MVFPTLIFLDNDIELVRKYMVKIRYMNETDLRQI
jgi:hypothetical protein